MSNTSDLRTAIGDPCLTGHSGGEDGCLVKLRYQSVGEAMRAHDALAKFLATRPPSDPEGSRAPCDCKIGDCKRITRRCLESYPKP